MFDLEFNNVHSSEFGIMVGGGGTYEGAERDYSVVDVVGRNGSLIFDNGRFKNQEVRYSGVIKEDFLINIDRIKEWLYSSIGYQILKDDYHIGEYRLAQFKALNISTWRANKGADIEIVFECKPQRFLEIGNLSTEYNTAGSIINPTKFDAKPIITLYGNGTTGTLTVNDVVLRVNSWLSEGGTTLPIVLDCDLCEAYFETRNENGLISGDFPVLRSGANSLVFNGGITKVEIVPRWWHV